MEPDSGSRTAFSVDLGSAFEQAMEPLRGGVDRPIGVLFSGGVDSALLAWELRTLPGVTLWTLGQNGSPDVAQAQLAARRLGLPWNRIDYSETEIHHAERRFHQELEGVGAVVHSVLLALALAIELVPPEKLVCGQGVDELFLGYAHYRDLGEPEAEVRSLEDLARLRTSDWPRTQQIARTVGKEILAPYLHPPFVEAALRVPVSYRLPGKLPKGFFRRWAVDRGLPEALSRRPKKAMQYGSGVDRLVRSMRRTER